MNGINSDECAAPNEAPHNPIADVPAADSVPLAPSGEEPSSGQIINVSAEDSPPEDEGDDLGGYNGTGRRKPGPKPLVEQHRMKLVLQFIDGDIPGGELGRLRFLQLTQFTPREKSFLVNHSCFKELYDAMIFDFSMRLEEPTKEQLKLLEILGKRLGLSKPATQVNVQVNNNNADPKKNRKVSIKVAE